MQPFGLSAASSRLVAAFIRCSLPLPGARLAPATSCRSVVDSCSLQLQQPAAAAFWAQCIIKLTSCSVHLLQPSIPWCKGGSSNLAAAALSTHAVFSSSNQLLQRRGSIAASTCFSLQLQQPPAVASLAHCSVKLLQPSTPAASCCSLLDSVQHQVDLLQRSSVAAFRSLV